MEIAISGGAVGTQVTKGRAPGVVVLQQVWWGGLCGLKDPHPPPPTPTPPNTCQLHGNNNNIPRQKNY